MGSLHITPMGMIADNLPILRQAGTGKTLSTTTSTARTTVPSGGEYLRLVADEAMSVKLGDGSVNAALTDLRIVAGLPEYIRVDGNTNIAGIDLA